MLNLISPEATMSNKSRRTFLKSTAAASILASLPLAARANPLGLPIGCQTWPVRQMIAKDFPGTIKTLAAAGFQSIELCSPIGYADSGFAGLARYSAAELKTIIADEYNKMGELAAKSGIQQGPHNEGFELSHVNGKRTYDLLLELLDPKLVKFQFQVSTISRGYDAAEYFTKYPGRFVSMHVQD